MSKTVYLCEKPNQGKIVAQALGGGTSAPGGITGPGWVVTWGVGHLMTPFMPHDYNADLKKWSWDPLPIVPEKFRFKPKDDGAKKQMKNIQAFLKGATNVIISTDPDREGEMIAYEILNELQWKGATERLWISDLNLPAVVKALSSLKDAESTKPLFWAAMARTYADWIVGMNMSRAATLKISAYGSKPMSVGRVQTPVLAMIVDLERKITKFKPQDYYEITALVSTDKGNLKMRHAPSLENRILDRAKADALRQSIEGAKGPLTANTEAKKESPPPLFNLSLLQQACNKKFSWSADKTLSVLQGLYEKHQILTYPRTDCSYLPEEHKITIAEISANITSLPRFSSFASHLSSPVVRKSVYDDKKVTAHHAIIPTLKKPDISALDADQKNLYILVVQHWIAAHLPDMEYLQTSITMNANGVLLKASGRQITKEGWKIAFSAPGEQSEKDDDEDEADSDGDQVLPPIKSGDIGLVEKSTLDSKKTKPPARFNEATLLKAMENVAAYVDDPAAKKILKQTSGIGTPATRANVIETLKAREYIVVKKRQISPTETAFTLIDAMRKVAPSYADPVMTARWEDVLEEIAGGKNIVKSFVNGIADSVRKDVSAIKDSDIQRMAGVAKDGKKSSSPNPAGRISGDWKEAIAKGTVLTVSFDDREKAKTMGARWDGERKLWVAPKGVDLAPFKAAKMIKDS